MNRYVGREHIAATLTAWMQHNAAKGAARFGTRKILYAALEALVDFFKELSPAQIRGRVWAQASRIAHYYATYGTVPNRKLSALFEIFVESTQILVKPTQVWRAPSGRSYPRR